MRLMPYVLFGKATCLHTKIFLTSNYRRAFWDKRISQEVNGDALGEVCMPFSLKPSVSDPKFCWIFYNYFITTFVANRSLKAMYSKLLEAVTNKDSQWSRECWPLVVSACCFIGVSLLCTLCYTLPILYLKSIPFLCSAFKNFIFFKNQFHFMNRNSLLPWIWKA